MEIDEDKDFVVDAHKKLSSRLQTKSEKIPNPPPPPPNPNPNSDDLFKTPTKSLENESQSQNQSQSLDSSTSSTPLKLEVSESENDSDVLNDDVDVEDLFPLKYKKAIEKKILLVQKHLQQESSSNGNSSKSKLLRAPAGDDSLSSPRTSNSSDDYVLGFDEISGAVQTIKDKDLELSQYLSLINDQESEKLLNELEFEDLGDLPFSFTTRSSTRKTKTTTASSTSKRSKMHTSKTSPKLSVNETPQQPQPTQQDNTNNDTKKPDLDNKLKLDSKANNSSDEKTKNKKLHVVGDNDELAPPPSPPISTKTNLLANMKIKENRFKKPFEFGWKREVVWRIHPSGKEKADIFFVSPLGKKLRSRNEIMPLLAINNEHNLQIEDFSFAREPLGLSEEFEIVRHAKNLSRSSLSLPPPNIDNQNSPATTIGKRVSKPKVPKGASPPPEGWTPTKALKMNNTALQTGRNPPSTTSNHNTTTPSSSSSSTTTKRSSSASLTNQQNATTSSSKSSKNKKSSSIGNVEKIAQPSSSSLSSSSTTTGNTNIMKKDNLCNGKCVKPQSTIKMRCKKCLQTYHPECVGLKANNCEYKIINDVDGKNDTKRNYLCETCYSNTSSSKVSSSMDRKEKEKKRGEEKSKSNSTVSTSIPPTSASSSSSSSTASLSSSLAPPVAPPIIPDMKYPQTLAVVKGKKYVMVSKPIISNVQKDIDNEEIKKKVSKSIRNMKKVRLDQGSSAATNPIVPSLINSNQQFAANFFSNVSSGYESLIHILKYLKIHERSRAASVCKLWYLATKDPAFWHTVRMKNSKVCDWTGFASALRRGETKHLDLRKMLLSSNSRSEEGWKDFLQQIGTVCTLEIIDMCRCSAKVIETLFQTNKNLRILNALAINDTIIDLTNVQEMHNLQELRLRPFDSGKLRTGLEPLQDLKNIKHLSLTGINDLGAEGIEILANLTTLQSLELGECGQFDTSFAQTILPNLKDLRRLRMENNQYSTCDTLIIVKSISMMRNLEQLELVNFDIKPGFDLQLSECKNLKKILIIPTYISQSATTNNVVLSAIQKISKTIQVFTWGVTIELLRVTALYVDQCDGSSKKEKQFDECIPVLKPVPGATTLCDDESKDESVDEESETDVPQIEILPLERVETILANNLPNTKYYIVKIPYHATCKQHLVE